MFNSKTPRINCGGNALNSQDREADFSSARKLLHDTFTQRAIVSLGLGVTDHRNRDLARRQETATTNEAPGCRKGDTNSPALVASSLRSRVQRALQCFSSVTAGQSCWWSVGVLALRRRDRRAWSTTGRTTTTTPTGFSSSRWPRISSGNGAGSCAGPSVEPVVVGFAVADRQSRDAGRGHSRRRVLPQPRFAHRRYRRQRSVPRWMGHGYACWRFPLSFLLLDDSHSGNRLQSDRVSAAAVRVAVWSRG